MAELTVLPPTEQGLYPVRSGEKLWHVDPELGECDCPHWLFRCVRTRDACKHIRAVREAIEAALACPYCHGKGWLIPDTTVMHYVKRDGTADTEPLACLICSGSGKR